MIVFLQIQSFRLTTKAKGRELPYEASPFGDLFRQAEGRNGITVPVFIVYFISVLRQLSGGNAKQKTTRYAGGEQKVIPKKSPVKYNKGVQAYCRKKGDFNGKSSK